jgi:dTDP-4-amino-4,6-dideoxygalactose transaminase
MRLKSLVANLPSYPHKILNVYSGTNNFSEMKRVAKKLLSNSELVRSDANERYISLLQSKFNSEAIFPFATGRMGFYTILASLKLPKDSEVIIPSYTCVVVPNAILYAGAKPIYCDINCNDFNIDVSKIESLITPRTKVLYAQHTFGQMCDIEAIKAIAKRYDLVVIEDVALSLGARHGEQYAGTIGDFGYFSTDRTKVINTSTGGFVSVNNPKYRADFEAIYEKVPYLSEKFTRKLARTFLIDLIMMHPYTYWLGKFTNPLFRKLGIIQYFLDERKHHKEEITEYPYPARLSSILAEIGISQIEDLERNLAHRKKMADYYNRIFQIYDDSYIHDPKNLFLRYSFLIKNRDKWEKRFAKRIDLSIWFKTIAAGKESCFTQICYTPAQNRYSEYVAEHIFNLPTHYLIDSDYIEDLLYALKESGDIIYDCT